MDKTTDMPTVMDDAVTFEAVYDRYFDPVFRFVYYRTGNREAAKDLTADIFLKVYRKFSDYDPKKGSFEVWLYTIAGNRVKDYYRKKNRFQWVPLIAAKDVAEEDPTTEERMENKEEIAFLRCAVKKTETPGSAVGQLQIRCGAFQSDHRRAHGHECQSRGRHDPPLAESIAKRNGGLL